MNDAAKNDQADEALAAINQIMADVSEGGTPAPAAAEASDEGPAPILDLTRRVNPDGTVTDLNSPGASGEDRVQSAFSTLRDVVADQGLKATESASPALEAEAAPHIKAWLDEHLPAIVERVVREEVERLARRA